LELIRYIHLNPLRAGLVKDLKELDKYIWTGHSAIMGKKKNPFVPKQQANNFPFAGRRITFSQFRPETEKVTINPENPVDPACPARPVQFEDHLTGVGSGNRTGTHFTGATFQVPQSQKSFTSLQVDNVPQVYVDFITNDHYNNFKYYNKN